MILPFGATVRLALLSSLLILTGALAASAQAPGSARTVTPAAPTRGRSDAAESSTRELSPRALLEQIATAWRTEDLSLLLRAFGDRRVAIDVGGAARAGEYGPAQGYFFFKRLFDRTQTRKFDLNRYRASGDAPHAVFDWRYVDERTGGVHRSRLVISLRREAGTWVVDEIRAASRR
ncbi:MAG: hypothetical protein CME06_16365 [Gemmatimonadetes bacterium]|nr:hypothetical protein [Gemmatimonadota bacterium]